MPIVDEAGKSAEDLFRQYRDTFNTMRRLWDNSNGTQMRRICDCQKEFVAYDYDLAQMQLTPLQREEHLYLRNLSISIMDEMLRIRIKERSESKEDLP